MWANLLAVASGGAIGALLRHGVSLSLADRGAFPWGTLVVNVSGSLLFGFFVIWLSEHLAASTALRAFVLVGVLGAFTTFSTFSWETLVLLQEGETLRAVLNILVSVASCVIAAAAGVWIARQFI